LSRALRIFYPATPPNHNQELTRTLTREKAWDQDELAQHMVGGWIIQMAHQCIQIWIAIQ